MLTSTTSTSFSFFLGEKKCFAFLFDLLMNRVNEEQGPCYYIHSTMFLHGSFFHFACVLRYVPSACLEK